MLKKSCCRMFLSRTVARCHLRDGPTPVEYRIIIAEMSRPLPAMADDFTVVAIIAAYNEADIIGDAVGALIDEGIQVYLIDNASNDGTVAEAERYRGRGLIGTERFDSGGVFAWEALLRRKEALSRELDANWFIHHDADEFRESPWKGLPLREAIRRVDSAGYNAIDFAVLNFWPTDGDDLDGGNVREAFRHYDEAQPFDRLQVKCWKKTPAGVDLAASGGHDVAFADRRVFPIRFLVRHYPIRGQAHGERKVNPERRARFMPHEQARGWHVQYNDVKADTRFVKDAAALTLYDPDAVRLRLLVENRRVEEVTATMEAHLTQSRQAAAALRLENETLRHDVEDGRQQAQVLQEGLASAEHEIATLRREAEANREQADAYRASATAALAEIESLRASRSWKVTAPLRAAQRLLLGH